LDYLELVPSPSLSPFVRVLWSLRAPPGPAGDADRIVPDGCPEILLNRADRFRRLHDDGSSHRQAEVLLVGPLRRALSIAATGAVDLIEVRFEPGGAACGAWQAELAAGFEELAGDPLSGRYACSDELVVTGIVLPPASS